MGWIRLAVGVAALAVGVQQLMTFRNDARPALKFETPARSEAMPAAEAAVCIRAVVKQAQQQQDAHTFPPTSREWTTDERTAATAVFRRIWDYKRTKVRECLTDPQAEAYGRVDVFVLMKVASTCGISTTPAASSDVIEGAAAGSMTADDKPLGPFFVGQGIARRDFGMSPDGWRSDAATPPPGVCASYMDLFGPHGRQFAGLLQTISR